MDFAEQVEALRPDIFFVNTDGYSSAKKEFCERLGIKLVVSTRVPHGNLAARSTTALRQECTIPYRLELGGGWLDQPMLNKLAPGDVVVLSIQPEMEFNHRSGLATSSRKKAIELWHTAIPKGNRVQLAQMLFCIENPPGCKNIAGSQDQLGILLPGLNRLHYDKDYWPREITSETNPEALEFIETHISLIALPLRRDDYDPLVNIHVTTEGVTVLSEATTRIWDAIQKRDLRAWGQATTDSFNAQLAMFPSMLTSEMSQAIDAIKDTAYGWKITGAGGGGYLVAITETPLPNAITIKAVR